MWTSRGEGWPYLCNTLAAHFGCDPRRFALRYTRPELAVYWLDYLALKDEYALEEE